MTVKELIEELKKFDEDLPVVYESPITVFDRELYEVGICLQEYENYTSFELSNETLLKGNVILIK